MSTLQGSGQCRQDNRATNIQDPGSCLGSRIGSSPLQFSPQMEYCRPPCPCRVDYYETTLVGSGAVGGGPWFLWMPPLLPEDRTRLLLLRILQAQLVPGHGVLPQLRPWGQLGDAGHTWREQKDQEMAARTW